MAAIVLLFILVVLLIVIFVSSLKSPFVINETLWHTCYLLVACLVGIILAALVATSVVFWNKRNKYAAIREQGWKILALGNDNHTPAVFSHTNVGIKENVSSSNPQAPLCSPCHCQNESYTSQQKKIAPLIDHTELHHYTERNEHHRQIIEHGSRTGFSTRTLDGNENPTVVTMAPHSSNLHEDVSPQNSIQLESYC